MLFFGLRRFVYLVRRGAVRRAELVYVTAGIDFNMSNKKLSYRRGTARCVVSVELLPIATQQCRN